MSDNVLAIIIGRAGSRGLPGKNSMPIAGQPMICHTIDDAKQAKCVSDILVSTDGAEIAAAARSMNVTVVDRPASLADDYATVDAAARHAVNESNSNAQLIVILYANVPVRPNDLIDRAVKTLRATGADSVQSYSDVGKYHPHWMMRMDNEQRVEAYHPSPAYRRQDLPKLFIPDGGVIAVTRDNLFTEIKDQPHAFLGTDRRGIQNPSGAVVDVDDANDARVAESILKAQNEHAQHAHR